MNKTKNKWDIATSEIELSLIWMFCNYGNTEQLWSDLTKKKFK